MVKPDREFDVRLMKHRSMLVTKARTLVASYLRSHVEPSDMVQNTMLEAHQHASKLVHLEERSFVAWLRRALRHNILDAVKQRRNKKRDVRRTVRTSELSHTPSAENGCWAIDTSPSQIAQRKEQIAILWFEIERLPDNQRDAMILKHLQGRSLKEVSETLGLSEPAVAGLLHRARQSLMKRMQDAGATP